MLHFERMIKVKRGCVRK